MVTLTLDPFLIFIGGCLCGSFVTLVVLVLAAILAGHRRR